MANSLMNKPIDPSLHAHSTPPHAVDEHPADLPLTIHDMTVAYHRKPVLWDVDLNIPNGLVGIIGPNGAGKSTLIKAVLDLQPRASGQVLIYGKPYKHQRHLVGYVPQRESVDWDFPVNALDVVAMGRYRKIGWFKWVSKKDKEASMQALERVGMADYATRQISQLSGGQQQRVFLMAGWILADAEEGIKNGDPYAKKWDVINYPALATEDEEYRSKDESICEEILPTHELRALRGEYTRAGRQRWWNAMFQQNPVPDEGTYFKRNWVIDRTDGKQLLYVVLFY